MIELHYDAVLQETEAAYLIEFEPEIEVWIPKSQSEEPEGGFIEVKEWVIYEKELDGYIA